MSATMIGLDTAKSVLKVYAVDGAGHLMTRRKLQRNELIAFFEKQTTCTSMLHGDGLWQRWVG